MHDAAYNDPRLVALYDVLEAPRDDLPAYLAMVREFGARQVLDIGAGTGTLALRVADTGCDVVAVDPAAASIAVARAKPCADRVRWLVGDYRNITDGPFDVITMTGNVAQAIVEPTDWMGTLAAARRVLRPGGRLVFETRDPAAEAWKDWVANATHRRLDVDGVGPVETWTDWFAVELPLVRFHTFYRFSDCLMLSESTLRFRARAEVTADLTAAGFEVADIRDAPDRPGREFVFVAR